MTIIQRYIMDGVYLWFVDLESTPEELQKRPDVLAIRYVGHDDKYEHGDMYDD